MLNFLKSKIFIGALCVVAALAIVLFAIPAINKRTRDTIQVVRVKERVEQYTLLTPDMLTVVEVGKYGQPNNVLPDIKSVENRYSTGDIFPSESITSDMLADASVVNGNLLGLTSSDKLAITVSIESLSAGFGGKLCTGDVVCVYGVLKNGLSTGNEVIQYPELALMVVVAVTNEKAAVINNGELAAPKEDKSLVSSGISNADIKPATVTLMANKDQAKRLIEIESNGAIHLALVGRDAAARQKLADFIPVPAATQAPLDIVQPALTSEPLPTPMSMETEGENE